MQKALEELKRDPDVIAVAVFTFDDLDGRQTLTTFDAGRLEAEAMAAGAHYIYAATRPGCECVHHEDDDRCEVIA